jgi:solute:Na+ symporter, SSS family
MTLSLIDISVLLVYLAAVVGFGCWFVRKSGTTSEFMAAGGALPGWAVGLSIFGTYLSSNTFLGVPGKAFGTNWNAFVFSLSLPLSAYLAVKYFVPFYRHGNEISAYHHLEKRFGAWARTYVVVCYLLTQVARMGSILFGVGLGLKALTGWPIESIILVTGALVTLYTLLGGIEAVIWTDVVQSLVLMVGAIAIALVLLFDMPEGPRQTFEIASAADKFSLGEWNMDFTSSTVIVVFLYGLFTNLTNFGIDQSFVQRYHTARDARAAAGSVWLGALLYLPIAMLFFFIGTALFSYYQTEPGMLLEVREQVAETLLLHDGAATTATAISEKAATLSDADIGDKVLPHFIVHKLPSGLAGLLIAAIFAAAMSSIDTSLNSSATIILSDIWKRYLNPDIDEKGSMRVLYGSTIVWGVIGTGVALAMIGVKSVLDAWWTLSGIFAGGMLGLFLLGLIARRAGNAAAATGVTIGILVIVWMTFSPGLKSLPAALRSPLHTNMTIVVGTLTIFLVGLLMSQRSSSFDRE